MRLPQTTRFIICRSDTGTVKGSRLTSSKGSYGVIAIAGLLGCNNSCRLRAESAAHNVRVAPPGHVPVTSTIRASRSGQSSDPAHRVRPGRLLSWLALRPLHPAMPGTLELGVGRTSRTGTRVRRITRSVMLPQGNTSREYHEASRCSEYIISVQLPCLAVSGWKRSTSR